MALVDIINLPKYYVCKNKETDEMFVCYVNGSCHIPEPTGDSVRSCMPTNNCKGKVVYKIDAEDLKKLDKMILRAVFAGVTVYKFGNNGIELVDGTCFINNGKAVIPKPITHIGSNPFGAAAKELKTLQLPSSLLTIDYFAFHKCEELSVIVLSEGIKEVNLGKFWRCKGLREFYLPRSITRISCNNLTHDELKRAFKKCVFCVYKNSEAERFVDLVELKYRLIDETSPT